MIRLANIERSYDSGASAAYALCSIDLTIERGEFLTIMGPSGAGKSTLLHILGMLDDPSAGEYWFMEENVTAAKEKRRSELHKRHMGFVFQRYHLIDELTVYENLETPLLYRAVKSDERKSRVCEVLDRFRIVGKKDLLPSQLSGGQQQLIGIARAVITNPDVILADEPTGNLNSEQGEEIMRMLATLNDSGTTIVQVTHSERNAAYGARTLHLFDGRIKKES